MFYDGLSRLLTANYNGGAVEYTYGYDVAGNLVNNNGVTRTYNAANQMVDDGTNTLTYDANGNLTNDGVNSVTWDRANRMLTAPGSTSYKYDGLGNRIQQTVSSVVTDYLNDVQPGLVKLLRQDDGTNVDHFVHAMRGIHSVDDGTDWTWYAQDGLGSVRGLVDVSAVVQETHEYDPYGNYIGTAPTDSYIGFTGEQTAGNGQVYLRARYYNPSMGMFTALDPFEGLHDRPMSLNGYSWVEGNVMNMTDASGRCVDSLVLFTGIGSNIFFSPPMQDASCPHARQFIPVNPAHPRQEGFLSIDFGNLDEENVNVIFRMLNTWFQQNFSILARNPSEMRREVLTLPWYVAAERARAVGYDDAASNLIHFLEDTGISITLDVDKMLEELPRFRETASEYSLEVARGIMGTPSNSTSGNCNTWQTNSWWKRVGKHATSSEMVDIYPNVQPNLMQDTSRLWQGMSSPELTNEFDWFIAMNAFDYYLAVSVVENTATGTIQVCYEIVVEDYYAWYINEGTGALDRIMGHLDAFGYGESFKMAGRSSSICTNLVI